jgi:hypothetical protein
MLAEGKISKSDPNMGAPILFIPKPNGKLRLSLDYKGLNAVIIKDSHPLPLMAKLRD